MARSKARSASFLLRVSLAEAELFRREATRRRVPMNEFLRQAALAGCPGPSLIQMARETPVLRDAVGRAAMA